MSPAVAAPAAPAGALPPGPRWPRPVQAYYRMWRYEEFSDRNHERYGHTFTVRAGGLPAAVITNDRDAIRRLFTGDPLTKRTGNDFLRMFVGKQSVLVIDPAEHLVRRKMLAPSFQIERVRSYARLMEELAAVEVDRLQPGEVVAFQPIARALTLNVIMQTVLGVSDGETRRRMLKIFDALDSRLTAFALLVPQLARRSRWNLLAKRTWGLKDELDGLLREHIAATRNDETLSERTDILAMLVAARDEDGLGLSDEQLHAELVTLIAAGHETTATTLAWGVELLVRRPAIVSRAREGDDAYLDAIAKEILRFRTPVPLSGARHMLEPFPIGEWVIPANVPILFDAYSVHHNPEIFPEPHIFRPERFLEEPPPDRFSFLAFGGGAHRCLGVSLALLEIKIILRELFTRLDLEPVSAELPRPVPRGPNLAPRGGARVRVTGRRAAERVELAAAL